MAFVRAFLFAGFALFSLAWADEVDTTVPDFMYQDEIGSVTLQQTACHASVAEKHLTSDLEPLFKSALYKHISGVEMKACWFVVNASLMVLIVYEDGDTSGLPLALFQPVAKGSPINYRSPENGGKGT